MSREPIYVVRITISFGMKVNGIKRFLVLVTIAILVLTTLEYSKSFAVARAPESECSTCSLCSSETLTSVPMLLVYKAVKGLSGKKLDLSIVKKRSES